MKDTGEVMGCHETKEQASAQIYAINRSEGNVKADSPCWEGYVQRGMKEQDGKMVPNCIPVEKTIWEGSAFDRKRK
jgi:hypothetical protein